MVCETSRQTVKPGRIICSRQKLRTWYVSDAYAPVVWDVLTTLQGFAMETVANRSSEGALDSPIKIGGETGTQLLEDQVKVPKSVEHAVPESDGGVISPSGSGEEAPRPPLSGVRNLFGSPPPMGGDFGAPPGGGGIKWFGASGASTRPNTQLGNLPPSWVVSMRRLVAEVSGVLVHPQRRQDPMRRQTSMRRLGQVDESSALA